MKKARAVMLGFAMIALLGLVTANYLTVPLLQSQIYSADGLYLPALFADLTRDPASILTWHTPPAPYVFPDFLIYGTAQLIDQSPFWTILWAALLQVVLTFAAFYALARALGLRQAALGSFATTGVLVWLGLQGSEPFQLMFITAHHYGVFLTGLFVVALWLRDPVGAAWTERRSKVTMLVLCFASTFSDSLFLLQVPLPLLLLTWLDASRKRRHIWKLPAFPLVVAAVAGHVCLEITRRLAALTVHDSSWTFDLLNFFRFFQRIFDSVVDNPIFGLIFAAYLVLLVVSIQRRDTSPLHWLVALTGCAMLSTWLGGTLLTNLDMVHRYMIGVHLWPVFLCVSFIASQDSGRMWIALPAAACVALAAIAANVWQSYRENGFHTAYEPQGLACIQEHASNAGLRNGVTTYWFAKPLSVFSEGRLVMTQVTSELRPQLWITNRALVRDSYDFMVLKGQPKENDMVIEAARALNGPPKDVKTCASFTLYLYGQGAFRTKP